MNRVGFPYTDFQKIIDQVQKIRCIVLKGIYSHFSTSDESNNSFTKLQIKRFKEIRDYAHQVCNTDIIFHMANSGAIMQHPDSYFDLVRPGIMLYGQPPSPDFNLTWDLREVMALQSRLGLVKLTEKNEPVSATDGVIIQISKLILVSFRLVTQMVYRALIQIMVM